MNNKGFTLIELLASVALIAIISLIITPMVTSTMRRNKIESCNSLFSSVETAAKNYVSDNRYDLGDVVNGSEKIITTSELNSLGYLNKSISKHPITDVDGFSISVSIKYDSSKNIFKYELSPSASDTCHY